MSLERWVTWVMQGLFAFARKSAHKCAHSATRGAKPLLTPYNPPSHYEWENI